MSFNQMIDVGCRAMTFLPATPALSSIAGIDQKPSALLTRTERMNYEASFKDFSAAWNASDTSETPHTRSHAVLNLDLAWKQEGLDAPGPRLAHRPANAPTLASVWQVSEQKRRMQPSFAQEDERRDRFRPLSLFGAACVHSHDPSGILRKA